ncbi:MAG: C69 family dipeptidase [Cyclobacteriaceae bacterium]|nr:C69 family dipeptidase [Cyclobacteriaceae bacterium]
MCDTFVALPKATYDGHLLLAKNSDREPHEAQAIIHCPRMLQAEASVQCTFISIPQVSETYECILSKPFQMWGAEMGVNEYGVSIGNEAVFTKVKFEKHNNGLTGMDLLRLALERSQSAREAVTCITSLLELYGQNACGGYKNKRFYYHNSFLIADSQSAFVLETAGLEWVVQEVNDIRSISNRLSIGTRYDQLSSGAMELAKMNKWWNEQEPFDFHQAYSDWLYTRMGRAAKREACTAELAIRKRGKITAADCMTILQTHNTAEPTFKPSKANTGSICMHATGLLNPSSTTGSMVAQIRTEGPHTVWLTGTPHPCLSIYIPFFFGTDVISKVKQPSAKPDDSLWWRAEMLHRWISKDYKNRKVLINEDRISLQQQFIKQENELIKSNVSSQELTSFSQWCVSQVNDALIRWSSTIPSH